MATILQANHGNDETIELIMYLYGLMDDDEKNQWSPDAAEEMIADQHTYEIEHGITPHVYAPADFYETIRELIAQDAEE